MKCLRFSPIFYHAACNEKWNSGPHGGKIEFKPLKQVSPCSSSTQGCQPAPACEPWTALRQGCAGAGTLLFWTVPGWQLQGAFGLELTHEVRSRQTLTWGSQSASRGEGEGRRGISVKSWWQWHFQRRGEKTQMEEMLGGGPNLYCTRGLWRVKQTASFCCLFWISLEREFIFNENQPSNNNRG